MVFIVLLVYAYLAMVIAHDSLTTLVNSSNESRCTYIMIILMCWS